MKERYISLMAKALGAYTDEHILSYFESVKHDGLSEHGFPRLTSNLGLLICYGYRCNLLPLFIEMMDFCTKVIPTVKAANDFSVKEIICCIIKLEEVGLVTDSKISDWKNSLSTIKPDICYDKLARTPEDNINNWGIFTMLSEWMRQYVGLCDATEFVDIQIASQLKHFDENGMYRDPHRPLVYDAVPRMLFSQLLHFGYCGRYRDELDERLRRTGLLSLRMQSVTGEFPFGGRSNQFLFNEAIQSVIFEYEASRYAKLGNTALAARFKKAIDRSLDIIDCRLTEEPIRHIKNRFPIETSYGCEKYAYFDKYMITVASFLYCAYSLCDGAEYDSYEDISSDSFELSSDFHKLFLRAEEYFLEFDTNADPHYDSNGLGRVHRKGAPSSICLTVPGTATPKYSTDRKDISPFSLCPGIARGEQVKFAADMSTPAYVISHDHRDGFACATVEYHHPDATGIVCEHTVTKDGITIKVSGVDTPCFMLPAFEFDGKYHSTLVVSDTSLEIRYLGWICRYTTNGKIEKTDRIGRNRNGHYAVFYAHAKHILEVKIAIEEIT